MAADPTSKVNMDPKFEKQLRKLKKDAKKEAEQRKKAKQAKWDRPEEWSGDTTDYAGMHKPFDRQQANDELVQAISDPKSPGTTGDVVAASVMINRLSTMERAFKVRHTLRRCRATALMIGRKQGHGDDSGPFSQLGIEYVRAVIKQSKKPD
jgi:hypothetical protein